MNYNNGMDNSDATFVKYLKFDWIHIQELYNQGLSRTELFNAVSGLSHGAMAWAAKTGRIQYQTLSERHKRLHELGKVNTAPYKTKSFRAGQARFGGYKANAGKCKAYYFHSRSAGVVHLNGTWELQYAALYLEQSVISWKRVTTGFTYEYEGKTFNYYPDFYLPDTKQYVEVKGYKTPKDECKWATFRLHHELIVVTSKELTLIDGFKYNKSTVDVLALQNRGLSLPITDSQYLLKFKEAATERKIAGRIRSARKGCIGKPQRDWASFGDIKTAVWQTPLSVLAKNYGVSDVALKKHCISRGISVPPQGYWRRRTLGYSHEQALLPVTPGATFNYRTSI